MRAGIALGSNLGDRIHFLEKAVSELQNLHEQGEFLVSSFIETEPQDCPPGSPSFLNAVVELGTTLTPLNLLHQLQSIEINYGRSRDHGFHSPRTLDLDILYLDKATLQSPQLQLPHPRIRERYFVLKPLSEIRPELILPGWSEACGFYLSNFIKKKHNILSSNIL